MPLEIMIDTKRKRSYEVHLRRMDELEEAIDEIPELSKPISIVNLVKYSASVLQRKTRILRFTHFAGAVFILSHAKNAKKFKGQRESYVDSTGQLSNHNIYA
jgi:hypothetical protein